MTPDVVTNVKIDKKALFQHANAASGKQRRQELFDQLYKKFSDGRDAIQKMEADFYQVRKNRLAETGSWLETVDQYRSWTDYDTDSNHVLVLTGRSGSGKTFLASAILEKMKSQYGYATGNLRRIFVASNRFSKNAKSLRDNALDGAAKESLRIIALQLANKDFEYLKKIVRPFGVQRHYGFTRPKHQRFSERDAPFFKGYEIRASV